MKEKPYIHLLKNYYGCYCYDVNKNEIIQISNGMYNYLAGKTEQLNESDMQELIAFKNAGYLKCKHVKKTENFVSEYYDSFLKHNLSHVTLQVTQQCNLNCSYCIYSGDYINRLHSEKSMLWETAKKAIDYLIANSQDSTDLGVSFYGGEPLLEFEFIKKCIIYAEAEAEGRQIKFNFTTNGTLLSKEKFNFLIEHDVAIMMSLDGPKEVHDKKRKFGNGKGSFELIVNNLTSLKEYNKEYLRHHQYV